MLSDFLSMLAKRSRSHILRCACSNYAGIYADMEDVLRVSLNFLDAVQNVPPENIIPLLETWSTLSEAVFSFITNR